MELCFVQKKYDGTISERLCLIQHEIHRALRVVPQQDDCKHLYHLDDGVPAGGGCLPRAATSSSAAICKVSGRGIDAHAPEADYQLPRPERYRSPEAGSGD
jgi:hypothetical protein